MSSAVEALMRYSGHRIEIHLGRTIEYRVGIDTYVRDPHLIRYEIENPPSIAKIWPVVFLDSSDARNSAVIATSSGSTRPSN